MNLPSPLEISALAAGCAALAALAIFLLHSVRIAVILGMAAGVLFLCAGVAHGYKEQGSDEVQAKWDADKKARMEHLAQVIVERQNDSQAAEQSARDQRLAGDAKFAELASRHAAQSGRLRDLSLDNDLLSSLLDTVHTANSTASTVPGQPQAAPASPTARPATGQGLDEWFQVVAKQYNDALLYGDKCVDFYERQRRIN